MSLNGMMNIASSGLLTAQAQLRTVSDNVSNLSTPGYIRKLAEAQSRTSEGRGAGVEAAQLRLATDRFLQAAGLRAAAASAEAKTSAEVLDRAQALFGDPTGDSAFLGGLDKVFAAFGKLAADSSASARNAPLAQLDGFLSQARGLDGALTRLARETDEKLAARVDEANGLLRQIDALNVEISRGASAGADVTGSQNQQSGLVDRLSALMDVRVAPGAMGGVVVRASDGLPLAGDGGAATLAYDGSGVTGLLSVTSAGGVTQPLGARLASGELKGLADLRNTRLPGMSDQLGELMAGVAGALNAAHNAYAAAPPAAALDGRATWLSAAEAFGGFTAGRTTVAVTDGAGVVSRRVDIDFAAGTMRVDGGAPAAFTPATFASGLNTALGSFGSASFGADGALKLSATAGGVAVSDDPAAPTSRAGRSFSGFFGLNDLVVSSAPADYATGLKASDASGFTGAITLRLSDADGVRIKDVTVNAPAAPATMADLMNSLNNPVGGAGLFGSFALDADGRMAFTPRPGVGVKLDVAADTTARGAGGPSLSALFGVGEAARSRRAQALAVRGDIAADPSRLSLAAFDRSAAVGAKALSAADVSGADALGQAGKAMRGFAPAGGLPGGALGVSDYAAKLGADVARRAADAASAQSSAEAVAAEATSRRQEVEGVNLDQELVNLTTYQQAYNASARLISAARDLYDVLLNMI